MKARPAAVGVVLAVVLSSGVVMAPAVSADPTPVSGVTPVTGGPERLPVGTRAVGALPGDNRLSVDVALRPADPAGLAAFDQAVTTPGSPVFRHFLAPGEFARRFGPGPAAVAAMGDWLRAQGLDVGPTTGDGLLIPVSGPASALGQAFAIGFERQELPDGRIVREPTARPSVPTGLAQSVQGVVGLDDLAVARPQLARGPATKSAPGRLAGPSVTGSSVTGSSVTGPSVTGSGPVPHAGPSPTCNQGSVGTTATQLAQAYSMTSLYPGNEGQSQTVGIYELEPYLANDISTFESCYSPAPSPSITPVSVDGAATNSGPGSGESALDIEMVVGLAPRASIRVYVGPNGGTGPLDVYAKMIGDDQAQVLTTSWGECEPAAGITAIAAESNLLQMAAAQGQSFTAAAGDEGSEDCNSPGYFTNTNLAVDDPASQPFMTSVGGTELGPALGPPPTESVWNTGTFEGTTGGGISSVWTMPSWQLGPGVENGFTKANNSYTGRSPCPLSSGPGTVSCREVPDVSADGDPGTGYATFCSCTSGWRSIGGTSMGAPLWASIAALADQSVGSPPGRIGLLNPALYQAGCLASPPFNDITSGNNQPNGSPPADPPRTPGGPVYPAGAGYDMASGLGTPVVSSLLADLVTPVSACPAVTSMSVTSGPSVGGTSVTLTGTNLGAVQEVDFGAGNAGGSLSASAGSVNVTTPGSPTGGWDTTAVVAKTANEVIGLDGRNYFTFTGPRGYWTTASDGGVFSFGQVGYHGSTGGIRLQRPVVGIAPTASSQGYWLVASDGGVFSFGDAVFHGSTGGIRLDRPIVGMAASPDGGGYWLVASDGGVFSFGDAGFYGSTGGVRLNKPIVGMAATPDGQGYWLVASDGGVFAFGNAGFSGSLGAIRLAQPIVGIAAPFGDGGYWLVASDGGIFAFGRAGFAGSMGGQRLNAPMVGMGGS
ncbi:MAG TPA: protease pro-enzyme activation domain-containing protein [Acidimicrobiales bacterium]|nr:protease pro-enzyme activation domain-containing protein [Acidimicrobiales bacterium]